MYQAYTEIFCQHRVLRQTYDHIMAQKDALREKIGTGYDQVILTACGSSHWLSLSAAHTFARLLGIPAKAVKSGDVMMHPDLYRAAGRTLLVAPSRSGTTSETLKAIRHFREETDCTVLVICEYPDSPILEMADVAVMTPWANEISICQTRSFSNLYMSCCLLAAVMAGDNALPAGFAAYLDYLPALEAEAEEKVGALSRELDYNYVVSLGSGAAYGVAIEGAYICIEVAAQRGNYYTTLEMRHGPIVLLDRQSLVCLYACGQDDLEDRICAEAQDRGAHVMALGGNIAHADTRFSFPELPTEALALCGMTVMQALAYFTALKRGVDPDNPAELNPYITL